MSYNLIIKKISYIYYYNIFNTLLNYIIQRFYNIILFISKNKILFVINIFKYNSLFQFNLLIESTVIDYLEKKNRFTLKYFFLSTFFNLRIILTVKLQEFSYISSLKNFYYSSIPIEREI